jgi:GTP 3',8-cyclase
MKDKCNREIKHIRFSVTSSCGYDCIYCDKEGFKPQKKELSVKEIKKLCRLLAEILNVTRIKFTGGEPLCRKEIIEIIREVKSLNLYDDISMTTNGYRLYEMAEDLVDAGLDRINVSLCSLNPETYKKITGTNSLQKVLKGLRKAKEVGLDPIKLNFVLLKGLNDNELDNMIQFSAKTGFALQLIELHKKSDAVGQEKEFYDKYHLDSRGIIDNLELNAEKVKIRGMMQNRKVFTMKNGAIIETIAPSHEFCMGCTKLRVGCDGNLFGCLFRSDLGKNLKKELNQTQPLSEYERIVKQVVNSREPYY